MRVCALVWPDPAAETGYTSILMYVHARMHPQNSQAHACMHAGRHACRQAGMHAGRQAGGIHVQKYGRTHLGTLAHSLASRHESPSAHIIDASAHTHTHTHTHTHRHTHTGTGTAYHWTQFMKA